MYDRTVGHDRVVSLDVQLTLVIAGVCQAVDRAALGARADRHTGDRLVASHTVHCPRPAHVVFWLLKTHDSNEVTTMVENHIETCLHNIG